MLLEKEPRSFLDISALIQTMSLKKFKFLTNSYVTKMRREKRREVRAQLSSEGKSESGPQKICPKYRYIGRLTLKPQAMESSELLIMNEGVIGVDSVQIKCNDKWPVCGFDHTFKNRCTGYFQYRLRSNEDEWIDDYFGDRGPKLAAEENSKSIDDTLLLERNMHYCLNKSFANKLNTVLGSRRQLDDAFPSDLIEVPSNESFSYNLLMWKYVEHVLNFQIPKESSKEAKEVKPTDRRTAMKPSKMPPTADPRKVFKTMTAKELEKMCNDRSDYLGSPQKRNSISIIDDKMIADIQSRFEPLSVFLTKLTEKTKFRSRDEDVQNSASGKFLYGILTSNNDLNNV